MQLSMGDGPGVCLHQQQVNQLGAYPGAMQLCSSWLEQELITKLVLQHDQLQGLRARVADRL